ncbi:hypothetical protein [Nitratifractor sp.]|uniref:hypothetical protein n=1 Tax=Nitratifractor sp. TaxID=2268144 RepID=UPI0025D364F2|nr:hypothetical protein [Nitratifractor sp.]
MILSSRKSSGVSLALLISLALMSNTLAASKGSAEAGDKKYFVHIHPADRPLGPDSLIAYTLPDQFGRSHTLSAGTRILIFADSKKGAKVVKAALERKPKSFLESHHAAYLTDVSAMPGVIFRLFALPAMRKSPYPILLLKNAKMGKRLAKTAADGKVLVLTLKKRRVEKIEETASASSLKKLLK